MSEKEPHELVYHHNGDQAPTWDCMTCGETVLTQTDGGSTFWLHKAQEEHVCSTDEAKAMLPHHAKKIKDLLDELGVRIEIYEDSYYSGSAELMLVDIKTRVTYLLETEELG